jgi:hypothetical protein
MPAQEDAMQKVIARCWDDEEFKERLVTDPAATLAAEGVQIPEGVTVRVVVESATERALVVPCAPSRGLPDESLADVVGGHDFWPDGGSCDEPIEY